MKLLKLAAIPAALLATSAFAQDVVVDQQVVAEPVAVSTTTYNPDQGIIKNTTTQLVDGTKTVLGTAFHPGAISAEAGTLGYGVNLGWAVNDKTELQAGWAGGDIGDMKDSIDVRDNTYKLESDFSNPYVGVQVRPASNWFTVGAGAIFPDSDVTLKSEKASSTKVNNNIYKGKLEANIESKNSVTPYLTVGFRPNLNNHWGVFGEVGAAYTGGLEVTKAKVNGVSDEAFKHDLKKDLNDEDYAEWFPIAKLGVTYRF